MQYKLRNIMQSSEKSDNNSVTKGITIPAEIAILFESVYFNITHSGASIILESGTKQSIASLDISNYKWEDFKEK